MGSVEGQLSAAGFVLPSTFVGRILFTLGSSHCARHRGAELKQTGLRWDVERKTQERCNGVGIGGLAMGTADPGLPGSSEALFCGCSGGDRGSALQKAAGY